MVYDSNNIIAKIIRQAIPADFTLTTPYTVSFKDIRPRAPLHILICPKGAYLNFGDFSKKASDAEKLDYFNHIQTLIEHYNLPLGGYQITMNAGTFANQEIFHFHTHLMANPQA